MSQLADKKNIKNNLTICIPIPQKSEGGLYRFLEYFRKWLNDNNIKLEENIESDYDILFTNSWRVDYKSVYKAKKQNPKLRVVHRMDGSAKDYGRKDNSDFLQSKVNLLADLTIFQSNYSKYATMDKFKVVSLDGPVIYNPVDAAIFYPDESKLDISGRIKVCNASFSTNPKKGTWKIGEIARQNPDVDFILCGRYPELPSLENIHMKGNLEREELASVMRSCDVFLFLSENESCANVVTEALASGLPVLYTDSGGNGELVGECGMPVDDVNFRERLMIVVENIDKLSRMAREKAVFEHSPDIVFKKYIDAMQSCVRRPMPTIIDYVKLTFKGYPVIDFTIPNLISVFFTMLRKVKAVVNGN